MGFEPTNGGFADLSLGPLGYRAKPAIIANLSGFFREMEARPHCPFYFFSTGAGVAIFASRKNRADSSGGVGLI